MKALRSWQTFPVPVGHPQERPWKHGEAPHGKRSSPFGMCVTWHHVLLSAQPPHRKTQNISSELTSALYASHNSHTHMPEWGRVWCGAGQVGSVSPLYQMPMCLITHHLPDGLQLLKLNGPGAYLVFSKPIVHTAPCPVAKSSFSLCTPAFSSLCPHSVHTQSPPMSPSPLPLPPLHSCCCGGGPL